VDTGTLGGLCNVVVGRAAVCRKWASCPVGGSSGAQDLGGQIRDNLGFIFLALLLLWSERSAMEMDTVSFNKATVGVHLDE
jgi:hypothetical protein